MYLRPSHPLCLGPLVCLEWGSDELRYRAPPPAQSSFSSSIYVSYNIVVQSLNRVWLYGLERARLPCPSLSPGAQTHVHWVSDAIQPFHPLSSPSPTTFNLSQHQGLFKWVSSLHQVAKVLELQLQHPSFQWMLGLISLRIDWFDLLSVQGTLKSLLQHHSSKTSILPHSAFFMVQLSHPYMTTGKTIAVSRQTSTSKVMSLFFICCLGLS